MENAEAPMGFHFIQGNKLTLIALFQRIPKVHFHSATGATLAAGVLWIDISLCLHKNSLFFLTFSVDNAQDTHYFWNVSHPGVLLIHSFFVQQIFGKEHIFNGFFS